mmetsp:Transcript_10214/g.32345  ORF Transcript_10214/g.32345 Transcript_10214/m.32345 type:complete len:273 (+) Transcript_10214:407-1225(+)
MYPSSHTHRSAPPSAYSRSISSMLGASTPLRMSSSRYMDKSLRSHERRTSGSAWLMRYCARSCGPDPRPTTSKSSRTRRGASRAASASVSSSDSSAFHGLGSGAPSSCARHIMLAGWKSPCTSVHGRVWKRATWSSHRALPSEASMSATARSSHHVCRPARTSSRDLAHMVRAMACEASHSSRPPPRGQSEPRSQGSPGSEASHQCGAWKRAAARNAAAATRWGLTPPAALTADARSCPSFSGDPGPNSFPDWMQDPRSSIKMYFDPVSMSA